MYAGGFYRFKEKYESVHAYQPNLRNYKYFPVSRVRALTTYKYRCSRPRQKFDEENLVNRSFIPLETSMNYGNDAFALAQNANCRKLAKPKIRKPKYGNTTMLKWR